MLSKNEIKRITSLTQKKYRIQENLFLAEGVKLVSELIQSAFEVYHIYATHDFETNLPESKFTRISDAELHKISQLVTPNEVVGLFKIPERQLPEYKGLIIVLDTIQDPGNLGTIIRLCDWFGVSQLVCSPDTVDCFNPKVVQATMGSLTRVQIHYVDLAEFLKNSTLPVYLTLLEGKNVYESTLPNDAILVMGNEANGISKSLIKNGYKALHIPRFGNIQQTESLNVAMATSIFLSEFRRRKF
jgi:TrmH family RNA methyltransferase